MVDMVPPVGAEVQTFNPQQGLSQLSGILGIQQQKLALQTGQAQLQTAQAGAQQAQQKNQEFQNLAKFTMQASKDPTFQLPDGSPDVQKFIQGANQVAPTYGQQIIGQSVSNFQEGVKTRQALQNLSADQNATLVKGLQGLANIPGGATRTDLLNWKDQVESNNKDPGLHRALENLTLSLQPDPGAGYSQSAAKAAASLGGLSMQQGGAMQLGGVVQPTATTTMGPGIGQVRPVGGSFQTVTPATNTTNAAGQMIHVPTGGAGLPSTAGPPGVAGASPVNPTTAQAGAQGDDNSRYRQISDSAQMAQTGQNLARNVALLAKGVQTGKMSGEVADWLSTIRQHDPGLTDRQLLSKYAAQLQNTALGASGGDTDLSRGVVLHGMPNPDNMSPDAIVDASHYIQGLFGMASARGQVASNYIRSNGGSPVGLRANVDDHFMANANPDVFAYSQIPAGKERQKWLTDHGYSDPTANAQLRKQLEAMKQYGIQ